MNKFKLIKQYCGIALVFIGLLGGGLATLYGFGINVGYSIDFFSTHQGGASNTPFLFGMLAFAGVWLLASIKDN